MAMGGIGGLDNGTLLGGDGTGRARFTLHVVDLALSKEARTTRGALLAPEAEVASDQEICFVLYVKNPCQAGSEIRIRDPLDTAAFTYIPNSLEFVIVDDDTTPTGVWSSSWRRLTDRAGPRDDIASAGEADPQTGTQLISVGAIEEQPNRPAQVPAASILAIRFRVRVN